MAAALPPSWYRLAAADPPSFPALQGSRRVDVCVVGGGYTGLSAALHLAEAGASVVLLEAGEIASGASGRNGGQIHSGQRRDVLWLESRFGFQKAKRLWDAAEEAKALVRSLIVRFAISCELRSGVIEAHHEAEAVEEGKRLHEALAGRFGYDLVDLLDRSEAQEALGSPAYLGALRDRGGGHLDPLRFAYGLARAASGLGADLHESSPALAFSPGEAGRIRVRTPHGEIDAGHVIVATNGRSGPLEGETRRRTLGVNSYVIATEPLGDLAGAVLPGGESAADSRFVVRYWRKLADGRLVFGGGESHAGAIPDDVAAYVRPHLLDVYPQLSGVGIAHGWGGIVTVTYPRLPFVREIRPGIWAAAGFSGQGVALAPFVGKLLAEKLSGRRDRLADFTSLPIPPVPGWTPLRRLLVSAALWHGRRGDS